MRVSLDRTIVAGLMGAVVFTAMAFGGVDAWAILVFEFIIITLALLWVIKFARDRRIEFLVPAIAMPVVALFVYGIVQSLAFDDSAGHRLSLSMDVEATRVTVVALFFLLLSFLIAVNFFTSRKRLRVLVIFFVFYGLGLALFGLIQHISGSGYIYWLRPVSPEGSFGPFMNRNHFAGYMELLVPFPIAFLLNDGARRELIPFYGLAAILMGVAIVISQSRGGMISLVAEILFLSIASKAVSGSGHSANKRARRGTHFWSRNRILIAITFAIIAGSFWVDLDPVVNRASQTIAAIETRSDFTTGRLSIWKDTLVMIGANPLLGVGLGAFKTAFPAYSHKDEPFAVSQAHNDYLQILADCGIIGGGIALWFIILIFRTVRIGLRSQDPFFAGLALACGAGICAILVHSLVDFNLQLLSTALLFFLLLAVASNIAKDVSERESEVIRRHAA